LLPPRPPRPWPGGISSCARQLRRLPPRARSRERRGRGRRRANFGIAWDRLVASPRLRHPRLSRLSSRLLAPPDSFSPHPWQHPLREFVIVCTVCGAVGWNILHQPRSGMPAALPAKFARGPCLGFSRPRSLLVLPPLAFPLLRLASAFFPALCPLPGLREEARQSHTGRR